MAKQKANKKKITTKKEKNRIKAKKIHIINESIGQLKKSASKAFISKGGVPNKFIDTDGDEVKWQNKLSEMRGSISKSRARMRARGKAVFKSR